MDALRLGVAGAGMIARHVHLPILARTPGVVVAAVADPSPEARAGIVSAARHAAVYASLQEMLEAGQVDALFVTSPSAAHAEQALATLGSDLHLYLEKPIAIEPAQGRSVAAAAAAASVVSVTGFNRRVHPLVGRLRALIAAGALGEALTVSTVFSEPCDPGSMPAWKRERSTGGGAGLDLASHHVDLLRFVLDAEVESVAGEVRSLRTEHDDVALDLVLSGDVRARVVGSFVRPRCDVVRIDGERGSITLDRYAGTLRGTGASRRPTAGDLLLRARCRLKPGFDPSYALSIRAFVQEVRGGGASPLASIGDGLRSLEVVAAAGA